MQSHKRGKETGSKEENVFLTTGKISQNFQSAKCNIEIDNVLLVLKPTKFSPIETPVTVTEPRRIVAIWVHRCPVTE